MRYLWVFFGRNYFFFMFLLFEGISVWLIVDTNDYQGISTFNSTNEVVGSVIDAVSGVEEYFILKKINQDLAEENNMLMNKTRQSYLVNDTASYFINDSIYRLQYKFVSAKVISNSTQKRNNYLKLNKGKLNGITKDMGVISPKGIVGQVIEVTDHFSSVMSVLNKNSRISVKHKKSDQLGTLHWEGIDYTHGTVIDIPTHSKVKVGDTIITSGFSHMFPEGLTVGTIDDVEIRNGEHFYTLSLRFTEDYNKLTYVNIIVNLLKYELDSLDKAIIKEKN